MNFHLPRGKKVPIILLIAIPMVLWFLSEGLPRIASGISRAGYRQAQRNASETGGRLTIFGKNSRERKFIHDLKFPLSEKSDPRLAHDHFQLRVTGLFELQKPGIYWVGTESDDGSWIWIDGKKVLDNGGLHSRQEKIDFVHLQKGIHFIELKFENLQGEAYLDIFWALPDGSHKPLSIFSFPYNQIVPYLLGTSPIFFEIARYWTFFLIPILLYRWLFPVGPPQSDQE